MKRIPLKMQLLAAEQELKDFSELFDLQHKRSVEADKLWQHDTGEQYHPDLGELLRYFMAQRELMYRLYWMLREGGYASDEYDEIMDSIERKDFCRPNSDLFGKSFSIRRDVLNLTMAQWKIADSLDLTSITPRDWIQAIGARGGFITALLTDEEREFVRIVYLPNTGDNAR